MTARPDPSAVPHVRVGLRLAQLADRDAAEAEREPGREDLAGTDEPRSRTTPTTPSRRRWSVAAPDRPLRRRRSPSRRRRCWATGTSRSRRTRARPPSAPRTSTRCGCATVELHLRRRAPAGRSRPTAAAAGWQAMTTLLKRPDERVVGRQAHARDWSRAGTRSCARRWSQARLDLAKHLGQGSVTGLGRAAPAHREAPGARRRRRSRRRAPVFNRGPSSCGGGSSIVNANGWDASPGYRRDRGAVDADGGRPRPTSTPRRGST